MKVLEDIKELIEEELKNLKKKGTLSPAELDSIHKGVETIVYIEELCANEEEDEEKDNGYSGRRGMRHSSMRGYSGTYPMMYPSTTPIYYDNNYSGHYDYDDPRMNRYSGCGYNYNRYSGNDYSGNDYSGTRGSYDNSYQGYSSEGTRAGRNYGMTGSGYSREGASSHMIAKLEEMLDSACTDKEQAAIYQCLDRLTKR